jgi:hypothetical protein
LPGTAFTRPDRSSARRGGSRATFAAAPMSPTWSPLASIDNMWLGRPAWQAKNHERPPKIGGETPLHF